AWSLNAPAAPHHWSVPAPHTSSRWIRRSVLDQEILDLEVSPDGERLAWVMWRRNRDPLQSFVQRFLPRSFVSSPSRWEVWVSSVDGSHLRQIGHEYLPAPESIETIPILTIQWLPDGKHLSFIYKDVLYMLPAD